jgi:hypothetical protein
MLPTTSNVFSSDTSASDFRRAVRRQVATRAEYALPGAGVSVQEVQQAYHRYLHAQNRGARQVSPVYTATTPEQAEQNEEAPPEYSVSAASSTTPTTSLNTLLYANISTPPLPPAYEDSAAPPSYEDLSTLPTTTATATSTAASSRDTNHLSHQNMKALFAASTTATHRRELGNTAIQALNLVVGRDGPVLPPREEKKGFWERVKGKKQGRRGMRGLRRV